MILCAKLSKRAESRQFTWKSGQDICCMLLVLAMCYQEKVFPIVRSRCLPTVQGVIHEYTPVHSPVLDAYGCPFSLLTLYTLNSVSKNAFARSLTTRLSGILAATPYSAALSPFFSTLPPLALLTFSFSMTCSTTSFRSAVS